MAKDQVWLNACLHDKFSYKFAQKVRTITLRLRNALQSVDVMRREQWTSVKLAAYSHSAADSPKKLKSKNTPKKVRVQPDNPLTVFSTFYTLLVILVVSTFSIIFSPTPIIWT